MSPNLDFFPLYLGSFEAEGLTLIKKILFIDFSQLQGPGHSPAQIERADFELVMEPRHRKHRKHRGFCFRCRCF